MKFVVKLQRGCWLADWPGDPGRTLVIDNAKRFDSFEKAARALMRARKYRDFTDATIDPAD